MCISTSASSRGASYTKAIAPLWARPIFGSSKLSQKVEIPGPERQEQVKGFPTVSEFSAPKA